MTHHYRPATEQDAYEMAPNMRSQDAEEVMASHGWTPLEALVNSYNGSQECNSIIHEDGDVVGMFGVSDQGAFAMPWLLGANKMLDTKIEFVPQAIEWVDRMSVQYPLLFNFVHKENKVAIRWLKSLGFEFIKEIEDYGVGQEPFIQFVRITKCAQQL
tara:strand:+ start:2779 stop:3252 length:474 start_codon:yes stop_codon:yes gene_type:complete